MESPVFTPKYPELIFGIAGPIGIDIDAIIRALGESLTRVGYRQALIRVTDEIQNLDSETNLPVNPSYFNSMKYKMEHASSLCRRYKDESYLMRIVLSAINRERKRMANDTSIATLTAPDDHEESVYGPIQPNVGAFNILLQSDYKVAFRSAYIIRQIKRPEEVEFLRSIYNKQFVLISAYGSTESRKKVLIESIKRTAHTTLRDSKESFLASKLIEMDSNEDVDSFGQHMRDTFHLADVGIDGISRAKMAADLERFISALFGSNEIGPSRAEYGMNAASTAALRSSDLSRQVGAVVFS